MSQPLDPVSVAAYVSQAQARTDDGVFVVTAKPTHVVFGCSNNVPDVHALVYRPSSVATARLFAWTARYRYRTLSAWIVGDVAFAVQVTGLLALMANDQFSQIDFRYPPTPYAPYNPATGSR